MSLALAVAAALYSVPPNQLLGEHAQSLPPWMLRHWRGLTLSTDRSDLVSRADETNARFLGFEEEFGRQGSILVVVQSDRLEKNRQFVEAMAKRLTARPDLFSGVLYKFDLHFFGENTLQFAPEADLRELAVALKEFRPSLEKFLAPKDFGSLFSAINREFLTAGGREDEGKRLLKSLPALRRIVDQVRQSLDAPDPLLAPEMGMLIDEPESVLQEMYLALPSTEGGWIFLMSVQWNTHPDDFTAGSTAIEMVKLWEGELEGVYPGLNVGVTGDPVLEYDEMRSAATSMAMASWITLLLVAALYIYTYREILHPIKVVCTLLVAVAWTFGFTTVMIGHLNILTITFVPILIGLGEDHGTHILSRYEEELARGSMRAKAMETAMAQTGVGVWVGALTMAGSFLVIMLTDFRGIQEMGLISGAGVLLSCLAMMTLLPALLALEHGSTEKTRLLRRTEPLGSTRAAVENEFLKYPRATLLIASVLTAASLLMAWKPFDFDFNLLRMQSRKLESVIYEKKLVKKTDRTVLFAATDCATLGEARELAKAFATKTNTVSKVHTIGDFFEGDPKEKLQLIRRIKAELNGLNFSSVQTAPVNVAEFIVTLKRLSRSYLTLAARELVKANETEAAKETERLIGSLELLIVELEVRPKPERLDRLNKFQQAFFNQLRMSLDQIRRQNDSRAVTENDVPLLLREQFVGKTGRYMVQVYPKSDIWEREPLRDFIGDLRLVRRDVTGIPVTTYEYLSVLRNSYLMAAFYALGAVIILAFLHFRNWRSVILSLVPLAAGMIWMLGIMGLMKIRFNPANIMILPLLLGYGVVNGIQMLHRAREEGSAALLSKSTGKAVLLTSITTIAGFGSLMIANHPGIASLGKVMSIGLITCLVSSIVLVPALLSLAHKKGWKI